MMCNPWNQRPPWGHEYFCAVMCVDPPSNNNDDDNDNNAMMMMRRLRKMIVMVIVYLPGFSSSAVI